MPPPGYEPFLDTILDDPVADAPRLVYADWLEEQGDPRAEFIRVQCELAALPDEDFHRERLQDRETHLLNKYGEDWRSEIPEWVRGRPDFRRGFIWEVMIMVRWQAHFGPELSRSAPVEKIILQNLHDDPEVFCRGPHIRHLSTLAIVDTQLDYPALRALMQSESALAPLSSLLFMGTLFGDTGALMLALSPHLTRLNHLELVRCGLQARAMLVLIDAPALTNLTQLDLSQNDLTDDCISTLVSAESMGRLTHLILNSNKINYDGVCALVESRHLTSLTHLELDENVFGDRVIPLLLERFPNLQHLSIADNFLTTGGHMTLHAHYGRRVRLGIPGSR